MNTEETPNPQTEENTGETQPQITLTEAVKPSNEDIRRMAIKAKLEAYVAEMAPGRPITPDQMAMQQWVLWTTIREIIRIDGPSFSQTYGDFLDFVSQHRRSAFNETHVFRALNQPRMAGEESRRFQRFMNLVLATCNRQTRRLGLKQINLTTTLRGFDGRDAARVIDFYDL